MRYIEEEKRFLKPLLNYIFIIVLSILGGVFGNYLMANTPLNNDAPSPNLNPDPPILTNTQSNNLITNIADTVGQSVVYISNIGQNNSYYLDNLDLIQGSGSGIIFSDDGHILTNNHVIDQAHKIFVHLADGRQFEAALLGSDPRSDLALLKIEADNLAVANLGDSEQVAVGELALAIGNPGGERYARSLTVGVISGLNRIVETNEGNQFKLIQTDAAINPGNSGGPLVNSNGQVIGINTIKIANAEFEGMGFAIPINTARKVIDDLLNYGQVIRPALQVIIWGELSPELAAYNNLDIDYGVVIIPQEQGVSEKAGLKQYDIITAINDIKVAGAAELQEIIFEQQVGAMVKVTVIRGDQVLNFDVELAQLE